MYPTLGCDGAIVYVLLPHQSHVLCWEALCTGRVSCSWDSVQPCDAPPTPAHCTYSWCLGHRCCALGVPTGLRTRADLCCLGGGQRVWTSPAVVLQHASHISREWVRP